ncbi:ribonuclease Z [Arenibacter sp. GZD96]|uniref:ribonuclease Z n=1 Tax=Aurantibrevibacter litoralis TaxID=3106030 RepID=UPI002AFE4BE2|nr:ribonuclease Z [Arenibacter sp. GZD-96]MEA1784929.1 ribonuclease Z [Arenibacter sp. GZD-96]
MKLSILGCYAATPRTLTNPTAQVLEMGNQLFLIDCGEGTQVQLRKNKVKFSRIDHIFISHLHGDHFFGLPGLISTFRLLGREKEVHIYGPKGIKDAITLFLKLGDSWTNYPLIFHELESNASELIYENKKITVHTLPLQHRIYTNGFLFSEKLGERKLNINAVKKYRLDRSYFQQIKRGEHLILPNGTLLANSEVSLDPVPPKKYAYCSDTAFDMALVPLIKNADVLYHESTFLTSESKLAVKTKHATAKEAALIAKAADVGQLILGHYSTRYGSIEPFKEEAAAIFPSVVLADDGKVFQF